MNSILVLGVAALVVQITIAAECGIPGYCIGTLQGLVEAGSYSDCVLACKQDPNCAWFTFQSSKLTCLIFSDCPALDESCTDCLTGEKSCDEGDHEPFWHLIIGGTGESSAFSSSVELYNWLTGEQCKLAEEVPTRMVRHSGAVIDGRPTVCGGLGLGYRKECYSMNMTTRVWEPISQLLYVHEDRANVIVPNKGWYLLGSVDSQGLRTKPQVLGNLTKEWVDGEKEVNFSGHCMLQLDDVTTVIAGFNFFNTIALFDWKTMTKTEQPLGLTSDRFESACALGRNFRGDPVVLIAGGYSKGMELWNPADGFVETISMELPPEENSSRSLVSPQLVSIKQGRDLLLYGGSIYDESVGLDVEQPGIYKFHLYDQSWVKVGSMLTPRASHVVIPVDGISC